MMSNPLATPSREQVERGVAVVTAEDNRWQRCDLKTISLLGNVLMRQLAADAGAVETVMFRDGCLTEASASNVLIVHGGTIVAPPKDNLILPGITYDATLEFAREAGMPFEMRPVPEAEALARRRDVAVVVDQGSARDHDGRRQAVRRRQARAGVPPDVRGCSRRTSRASRRRERRRLTARSAVGRPSSRQSGLTPYSHRRRVVAKWPWWNTSPRPLRALAGLDVADEQHVVAGAMARVVAALEPRDAALDQRRAGPPEPIVDAGEAVGVRPREPARELDLVAREHVDRVALGRLERGEARRRGATRLHRTSGGSSDTELNEFAVKPT